MYILEKYFIKIIVLLFDFRLKITTIMYNWEWKYVLLYTEEKEKTWDIVTNDQSIRKILGGWIG